MRTSPGEKQITGVPQVDTELLIEQFEAVLRRVLSFLCVLIIAAGTFGARDMVT